MSRTGNSTPGRRRPPTIHDVAREAGVSRGTVSRVLNGGHYVSPAAQEAVNAAIRRTGYVVNRHARSLITGRSDSVAFLLTEPQERFFEDPNFSVLLRGCTQALAAHDITLLLM
ncbi:LacI family DNA-binding transcriptional regulator, partial [Streptomyces sp. 2MCAF27]